MEKYKKVAVLLFILLSLQFVIGSVTAADHIVKGNTTDDYNNITNWLNTANKGSNLVFDIDQCDWQVTIDKSINVISNRKTKFQGQGSGNAFTVTTKGVNISGFLISNYTNGIYSSYGDIRIENNEFTKNTYGINIDEYYYPDTISNIIIKNNVANDNKMRGINVYALSLADCYIFNNTANNNYRYGIAVYGFNISNCNIYSNTANNNMHGIELRGNNGTKNLVYKNIANKNGETGITVRLFNNIGNNITENIANENDWFGILIKGYEYLTNNTIEKNTANKNGFGGLYIDIGYDPYEHPMNCYMNNNIIKNNILDGNVYGLLIMSIGYLDPDYQYISYIINNEISGNTIINNQYGIEFMSSYVIYSPNGTNPVIKEYIYKAITKNKITNNNISHNNIGITLMGSNNTLDNNNISYNDVGIYLINSSYNMIKSNNIIHNKNGIILNGTDMSITNNNISYNRIYNNTEALVIIENVTNNEANLNWWGINHPKTNYYGVKINTWYVLKLSADEIETTKNATKHYKNKNNTVLKYGLSTNVPVEHDPSQLPYFLVTVIGPNGEKTTDDIRKTGLSYYVEGKGIHSIESLSDNENIKLSVSFSESPTPPEPPVPPTPPEPPNPEPNNNTNKTNHDKPNNPAQAKMKNTGLGMIPMLLVLITILGIGIRKK